MTQYFDRLPFEKKLVCAMVFIFTFFFQPFAFAEDITLQWDANTEQGLTGYKVYYGAFSGVPYDGDNIEQGISPITINISDLSDPSNPEFKLTGLDLSDYYYFAVTAYDTQGIESGFSNEVFIGPDGVISPNNPLSYIEGADSDAAGCFVKTAVCK